MAREPAADDDSRRQGKPARSESELSFGTGRISGVLSFALGALCVLAVLCFRFPELLTTPDLRAIYRVEWLRMLLHASILTCLGLGTLSFLLGAGRGAGGARSWLPFGGILLGAAAVLLGGAWVETPASIPARRGLGLDWFVLNLLALSLLFVPLERLFARLRDQRIFRVGWRCDLAHFFVNHLLVQVTVLLTMAPATLMLADIVVPELQASVRALPFALQFLLAMFVADLFQYIVHRAMHEVPWLWRFHAVHHSSEALDWLAGSRLHLVDIVLVRAAGFAPLFWLGFDPEPVGAYLAFASFQAVFNHANVRFALRPLRWILATPAYHHWHHSSQREACDKNYAAHLPVIDLAFGTARLPDAWPERYGVEGAAPPASWLGQLLWPFRPAGRATPQDAAGRGSRGAR